MESIVINLGGMAGAGGTGYPVLGEAGNINELGRWALTPAAKLHFTYKCGPGTCNLIRVNRTFPRLKR